MLVLSESFHVFESRIACRCNRFPCRRRRRSALSIWHQLTQSIQRGDSSLQEKCMDFHEIPPRVAYDLAYVCISWSVHTNKRRTTHNALCGYYKFSFRIFRVSHSMKCQNMMGRPFIFESGAWNIFTQN